MESKVDQLVSVTGASYEVARRLLEACQGDLSMAISMHLESGFGVSDPASSTQARGPETAAFGESNSKMTPLCSNMDTGDINCPSEDPNNELSPRTLYEKTHGVRAPIPQTRGVLIEEDASARRIIRSRRLPPTVFDPFQDYSTVGAISGKDKQKRNLAELFKPPHDIMFHGNFHEARMAGQQKQKWLLVNLQDSKEFLSQVLNRDVWSNHNIKDLIKQYFIFWQIQRINDEGVRFKQLYNVMHYPCIAIIDPRTGEKMAIWNSMTVKEFMKEIPEFLADNVFVNDPFTTAEHERKSSNVDLSEESQLEAAIKASLQDLGASSEISAGKKAKKCSLVFSDDSDTECISITSSNDEDMDSNTVDTACNEVIEIDQDKDRDVCIQPQNVPNDLSILNRKRRSSLSDCIADLPRKKLRTDNLKPSQDVEILDEVVKDSVKAQFNGRLQRTKGKGKAGANSNVKGKSCTSGMEIKSSTPPGGGDPLVEETSASVNIGKEHVSHILFRLPDGTRVQKKFICDHPIEEMFSFLQTQGVDIDEHEVVTHFPMRNLSHLERTASFKHVGLFPRETIFIHTSD